VSGNRLIDFTLQDLNGVPFHFSDHRGKLILIDFWGSWCTSCMHGLPFVVDLQRRYGAQGLEVIGIAYEDGTAKERSERVNFVRTRHGINYKLLLGEGDSCPVLTRLNVKEFPTLLLVDERGEIVWRAEGLTPKAKARLEAEIRSRLLGD
jgi:thiol-disulfide isomerase/thioredoxin